MFPLHNYVLLDRRCAFPESPSPFGPQNVSHHHMLSLAGYLQSPPIPELCCPFQSFMVPALGCCLGLWTLAEQTRCLVVSQLLPAGPLRSCSWGLVLPYTAATVLLRLLNVPALRGLPLLATVVNPPFAWLPMFISHACFVAFSYQMVPVHGIQPCLTLP